MNSNVTYLYIMYNIYVYLNATSYSYHDVLLVHFNY